MYLILCRPRLLRPSTLPHSICFSIPFFLQMCPKNFICLSLMILISDLLYIAISITFVLSFFSVHDILNILRRNHSSAASSLLSVSLFSVQHSHPYKRTDQTYALSVLILVLMVMFLFVNIIFIFLKVSLAIAILFFISASLFAFCVMVYPRYLKLFTCFIFSPLQDILQIGVLAFFEMTMHSVFLTFISKPFSILLTVVVVRSV